MSYVVICREDRYLCAPDVPGSYVAATRRLFDAEDAAKYALTISPSREPRIVTPEEYLRIVGWTQYEGVT